MATQGLFLSGITGLARDKCQVPRPGISCDRAGAVRSAALHARVRPTRGWEQHAEHLLTPHPHARLCWAQCRHFLAESSKGWLLSVLLLQKKLTNRDISGLTRGTLHKTVREWGIGSAEHRCTRCPFSAWLGHPVMVAHCRSYGPQMNAPLGWGLRLCPCSRGLLHNSEA